MNVKGICWFSSVTIEVFLGWITFTLLFVTILIKLRKKLFSPSNKPLKTNGRWVDAITYKLLESPIACLPWELLLLNSEELLQTMRFSSHLSHYLTYFWIVHNWTHCIFVGRQVILRFKCCSTVQATSQYTIRWNN